MEEKRGNRSARIREYFKNEYDALLPKSDTTLAKEFNTSVGLVRKIRSDLKIEAYFKRPTKALEEILTGPSTTNASKQLNLSVPTIILRRKHLSLNRGIKVPEVNISEIPEMKWKPIGNPVRTPTYHWYVLCVCTLCDSEHMVYIPNLVGGKTLRCRNCYLKRKG